MKTDVTITWLGHSCFALEENDYRIILDPYLEGTVPGYEPLSVAAEQTFCSHEHDDHGGESHGGDAVGLRFRSEEPEDPWKVTEIHSFHDQNRGKDRGENIIRIFDDGKYRIAHMGDLGCRPENDQMELLKNLDVCLVPVGGFFTLPPEEVKEIMDALSPVIVVPMHYRFEGHGYGMIGTLVEYLKLLNADEVARYEGRTLRLPEDLKKQTAVLTYEGSSMPLSNEPVTPKWHYE